MKYSSWTAVHINFRKRWDQRFARSLIRFMTWRIGRLEKRRNKLLSLDTTSPYLTVYVQDALDRTNERIEYLRKELNKLEHVYVNVYITPFGKQR